MGTAGCVTVSCSTLWGPSHPGGVEEGRPLGSWSATQGPMWGQDGCF